MFEADQSGSIGTLEQGAAHVRGHDAVHSLGVPAALLADPTRLVGAGVNHSVRFKIFLLLDLDDLTVRSEDNQWKFLRDILSERYKSLADPTKGIDFPRSLHVQECRGRPGPHVDQTIIDFVQEQSGILISGADLKDIRAERSIRSKRLYADLARTNGNGVGLELMPGVKPLLDFAVENDIAFGFVTSSDTAEAFLKLRAAGLQGYVADDFKLFESGLVRGSEEDEESIRLATENYHRNHTARRVITAEELKFHQHPILPKPSHSIWDFALDRVRDAYGVRQLPDPEDVYALEDALKNINGLAQGRKIGQRIFVPADLSVAQHFYIHANYGSAHHKDIAPDVANLTEQQLAEGRLIAEEAEKALGFRAIDGLGKLIPMLHQHLMALGRFRTPPDDREFLVQKAAGEKLRERAREIVRAVFVN